jgi:hypothetical protein
MGVMVFKKTVTVSTAHAKKLLSNLPERGPLSVMNPSQKESSLILGSRSLADVILSAVEAVAKDRTSA